MDIFYIVCYTKQSKVCQDEIQNEPYDIAT